MSKPNAGLTLGTNLYRALRELLPAPALRTATITGVQATEGTCTVQYPGGNTQRVRGPALAINTPVFVRDGLIEGTAPALTAVVIEV